MSNTIPTGDRSSLVLRLNPSTGEINPELPTTLDLPSDTAAGAEILSHTNGVTADASLARIKTPKPKNILLIDNDRSVTQSYKELLESCGHIVTVVNSGKEAVSAFNGIPPHEEKCYSMVICNQNLEPGSLNGLEILRSIRKDDPYVYLILNTTDSMQEDTRREFITKRSKLSDEPIDTYVNRIFIEKTEEDRLKNGLQSLLRHVINNKMGAAYLSLLNLKDEFLRGVISSSDIDRTKNLCLAECDYSLLTLNRINPDNEAVLFLVESSGLASGETVILKETEGFEHITLKDSNIISKDKLRESIPIEEIIQRLETPIKAFREKCNSLTLESATSEYISELIEDAKKISKEVKKIAIELGHEDLFESTDSIMARLGLKEGDLL